MGWQEGLQVCTHAYGAHAGAAAAVRYTECLVQVQVGYVSAEFPRRCDAYQCVQVGSIDIHLPAVMVDDSHTTQ